MSDRIRCIADDLVSEIVKNLVKIHNETPPKITCAANGESLLFWPDSFCGVPADDINQHIEPLCVSWSDLANGAIAEASGWDDMEEAIAGALLFIEKLRDAQRPLEEDE
jgi:hypothetical protein